MKRAQNGIDAFPGEGKSRAGSKPSTGASASALSGYARELLRYIGRLKLDRSGVSVVEDDCPFDHPFRPVHDALGMIHADMARILARYQRNRRRLQQQERALTEKNAALKETRTTLEILLCTRREERRKQTARVRQRFYDLLLPIVAGLATTQLNTAQKRQVEFIRDAISSIGHAFVFNPGVNVLQLTPRETLTAYLVVRGCTTREAAEVMNTSRRTVEQYRAGVRKKAGMVGTGKPLGAWLKSQYHDVTSPGTH